MINLKNQILATLIASVMILSGVAAFANEMPRDKSTTLASMNIKDLDAYYRKDTLMLPLRK